MSSQRRIVEAEKTARAAVNRQEKTGRHLLLADALTTHGRALARLKRYSEALLAFRRAFDLSEYTGHVMSDAAVAAFQELGEHLAALERGQILGSRGLADTKQSLERDALRHALESANGSVTRAARSLGISFQALTYMLETRHKDLLKYRTPVRPRKRRK